MFGFIKNLLTNDTKSSPQKEANINTSKEKGISNSSILGLSTHRSGEKHPADNN